MKRIKAASVFLLSVFVAVACKDETLKTNAASGRDSESEIDTVSDSDTSDTSASAVAGFCHSLVFETDVSEVFRLKIGEGERQVVLSAETGHCSGGIGGECTEIPAGDAVLVELLSDDDTVHFSDTFIVEEDARYLLFSDFDDEDNLYIDAAQLTAAECNRQECVIAYYNADTCDETDPCDWIEDDYCDDGCADYTDTPLDDSTDCAEK